MKQLLLFPLLSGALLLAGNAHGQYKFARESDAIPTEKKTYHYTSKQNNNSEIKGAKGAALSLPGKETGAPLKNVSKDKSNATDPPVINNPIDIYTGNPALIKATLTVHFGNFNKLPGSVNFSFDADPYYDFHTSSYYISISNLQYSNIHADTVYQIPVYEKSANHWTVKYQDFVTKWLDAAHTHLTSAYWASRQGGKVEIQPLGTDGTINKVMLVLQFENGTKTIVWNNPRVFSSDAWFQFDQNFNPMK